jgi:formylmethanofuran dehydrogenase subunit E
MLEALLSESAAGHNHLCPRQVLGVRLGMFGLKQLGFIDDDCSGRFKNEDKRLLTIVETDGCGADGIAVATDCSVGRRTLRVLDFGKVAATFVDTQSGRSLRVAPRPGARESAVCLLPDAESRWHAYLEAYQHLPDDALFQFKAVRLTISLADILSQPDKRAVCEACGEEIINEREVLQDGRILCRPCAGIQTYWQ